MGNSPLNGGLISNGNQACQINVRGTSATLIFDGKKVEKSNNGKITEKWDLTYEIGKSICDFCLSKTINPKRRHDEALNIILVDEFNSSSKRHFTVTLRRDEVGLLHHKHLTMTESWLVVNWTSFTTNSNAEITETNFDLYGGNEGRKGIIITEWKRKNKYNKPYMGSVTHYFLSHIKGQDVGFSIAIKRIRVRNGQFDFVVNGPKQHPLRELTDMYDQLIASMKNTHYPHNNLVSQSESESDSDRNVDDDAVPSPHHRGQSRNAGGLVSNDGMYNGNYNGSTFIKTLIFGVKDKFM